MTENDYTRLIYIYMCIVHTSFKPIKILLSTKYGFKTITHYELDNWVIFLYSSA